MSDFPTSTDRLFMEESNPTLTAWITNPTDKFFLYSEGYKSGAEAIYNQIVEKEFYAVTLVYPMIFNYRQYLELRLKELITMGYKYLGEDLDFKDSHDLKKLWDTYRHDIHSHIIGQEDNAELLDTIEGLIKEFNDIDPGFSFRYPMTRGPIRKASLKMDTIDLNNFKAVIDKLIRFFEYQWDTIDHYIDLQADLKVEMMSQMYHDNGY